MHPKIYRLRSRTRQGSNAALKDLDLEFEGDRAFIIWDSIPLGSCNLKARVEIDPHRLEKSPAKACDYLYRGELVLPCPQEN